MSNIEKIRQEIERLKGICMVQIKANSGQTFPFVMEMTGYDKLLAFIDSLPEDTSCTYDTNELTPTPSVNIEDVARVQFASHAHVFDRKRKAVFDWEQFKEVAGIFYGFGKRDSLPEEKPSEDLEKAAENIYKTPFGTRAEDFIAGAEWQKAKDDEETADLMTIVALDAGQRAREELLKEMPMPEDTVNFKKGVDEGRRLEKDDLALTWEDMAKIDAIILDVNNEFAVDYSKEIDRQKFYEEVLKRFKEVKK